jgi:hypothetical protein
VTWNTGKLIFVKNSEKGMFKIRLTLDPDGNLTEEHHSKRDTDFDVPVPYSSGP